MFAVFVLNYFHFRMLDFDIVSSHDPCPHRRVYEANTAYAMLCRLPVSPPQCEHHRHNGPDIRGKSNRLCL